MFSDDELEWLGDAMKHYWDHVKNEITQLETRLHKRIEDKIDGLLNP